MLDWTRVQAALTRAGYSCGKIDGQDGPMTWAALFACVAGRPADAVLKAIGTAAAKWLADDPIAQTPARLAEFLAQTAHETGGYVRFEENLNYSALGLAVTWPSRFAVKPGVPNVLAKQVARKPEAIANIAYARPKEGNTQPGDGWRYRGRGMLQLTFRNNYAAAGPGVGLDLVARPELAADPATSLRIAIAFWHRCNVNACCDVGDYYGARGLTNAGSTRPKQEPIGLKAVAARRETLLRVLA